MIIYAEVVSSRLKYLVGFLNLFYKNKVELTTILPDSTSVYFNYSNTPQPNSIQIIPHTLLYEDEILAQEITIEFLNSTPIFFRTGKGGTLDYDIFAATFYMVSRYEEHLPFNADAHQRFPATESLAFKHHFLHIPVVDKWLLALAKLFNQNGGSFRVDRKYSFIQTVDIDKAYAYKFQAFPYNFLLLGKSLINGAKKEYTQVLQNNVEDPFNVYTMLETQHRKYDIESIYFIQCGKRGKYDKNLPVKSKAMKDLIDRLKRTNSLGIHPSYSSFNRGKVMKKEAEALSDVMAAKTTKSRQHYLMLNFPDTFRILENIGIREEYSLGFADQPGFRAGTCSPYLHYDLELETETKLKVFPLILMDVTLSHYLKLSKTEAIEKIKELTKEVKEVSGCFISLWHNSSFCALHEMQGWDTVFKEMMKNAAAND